MLKQVDVLVVDDDDFFRAMIRRYLELNSFSVEEVADGKGLSETLKNCSPGVVLLDLNLPDSRGLDLARELRQDPNIGIIILTGSDDDVDKIVGLEIGADDYLQKGVDNRELAARIRTILRRVRMHTSLNKPQAEGLLKFSGFIFNTLSRTLYRADGEEIPLTSHEFNLLEHFLSNPNRVLSRDQLMQRFSGRDWQPSDRGIDTMVVKLRRKIEPDPKSPSLIKTIRGTGYIFADQVARS